MYYVPCGAALRMHCEQHPETMLNLRTPNRHDLLEPFSAAPYYVCMHMPCHCEVRRWRNVRVQQVQSHELC